jgi:hypothetical protein
VNDQAITGVWSQSADSLVGTSAHGSKYYRVRVKNVGKMLMPIQMLVQYTDGTTERFNLPVDVWRLDERTFIKGFFADKEVARVVLDPDEVLADVNTENNTWEKPILHEGELPGN